MRKAATRISLTICLVLAGLPIGTAQQSGSCAETLGCLTQAPLLASAPRTMRDSPDHGLARRDATPIEKLNRFASQDIDQPVEGISSGESWRR